MRTARMSAAEAASATESAAGTAESARVSAATLCPDGHGEEKSQRRNREQAAHTPPVYADVPIALLFFLAPESHETSLTSGAAESPTSAMHYERTPCFTRLKPRVALAAHQNQNG
jgi:hypothetical protein